MSARNNRIACILTGIIITCVLAGCDSSKEYVASGEENVIETETVIKEQEENTEETIEENLQTEETEIETPKEKTVRLRKEIPKEPTLAPNEVTNLRIEIHKQQHALQLWDDEEMIAEYAVGLSKNQTGDKEKEGDNKNPKGNYYVCNKNAKSQYHLAFGLSYPNAEDAERGYETGLINEKERDSLLYANENKKKPNWYTALGGEIMIHGQKGELGSESDWTRGCFALNNDVMDMIWDYVEVGTEVKILPD